MNTNPFKNKSLIGGTALIASGMLFLAGHGLEKHDLPYAFATIACIGVAVLLFACAPVSGSFASTMMIGFRLLYLYLVQHWETFVAGWILILTAVALGILIRSIYRSTWARPRNRTHVIVLCAAAFIGFSVLCGYTLNFRNLLNFGLSAVLILGGAALVAARVNLRNPDPRTCTGTVSQAAIDQRMI